MIERRKSRVVTAGNVKIGGGVPISVQSMCNTDTRDIEKTLKEQIVDYLDKEQTAMRIKDHILRLADGFTKISDMMKKFGMLTDNHQKIKKGTIEVRNRIIHGGYFPTILEVEQAIDDAKFIIQQYNVKLFID